jgi:PPP family 3-phenylpropionic acid transporter
MPRTTDTPQIRTKGAMRRYCLQNIADQMAYCPVMMGSTYLLARGLSPSVAGIAVALGNLGALLLQPKIGSVADSERGITISRMGVIVSLASGVAFLGALLPQPVLMVAFVAIVYLLYQNLIGLVNSVAVYYQNRGARINYGVARGLGSASFSIVSAVLGAAVSRWGASMYMIWGAVLCVVTAASMLLLPTPKGVPETTDPDRSASGNRERGREQSYVGFLKTHRRFLLLFCGMSLAVLGEGAAGTYTLTIVRSVGGDAAEAGIALAIQAMVEIPGLWSYELLERRFKTSTLLLFSMLVFALRSVMFVFASSMATVYLVYAFQMFSFGIATPASISYANKHFGEGDKNKAVGLLTLIYAVANVICGPIVGGAIDLWGVRSAFAIVSVAGAVGCVLCFANIERDEVVS